MLLLWRALLMLGLAGVTPHAARRGQATSLKLAGGGTKGKMVRLLLDPSVQPHVAMAPSSSVADLSLSPWTYRESYVESRLPRRISHAQCLTSGCLSLQGDGEDAALEAKPIYYQVLVLHRVPRRNSKGGRRARKRYDLRLGTEMVAVGCTCVRPSVIPQQ